MRGLLVALLLAGALAGCLDGQAPGRGACPRAGAVATPALDGKYMQTDPAQSWQTVVYAALGNGSTLSTAAWSATNGWKATARPAAPGADGHFEVVTVEPQGTGKGNATWAFELQGPAGCDLEKGTVTWDLAAPEPGMSASPGQGVHVMTAGFLENGTLFYTNIPEVDTDPRWPHVPWYLWEGDLPLPVYVYDQDRHEMPDHWRSAHDTYWDEVGPTGSPADPILSQYTMKADETVGFGYLTTIRGFNDALKGLSTRTTHAVHVAPEDAYTRPGLEDHVLYGQAVVFYIKVLDVVDAPCPHETPTAMCNLDVLPTNR